MNAENITKMKNWVVSGLAQHDLKHACITPDGTILSVDCARCSLIRIKTLLEHGY